KSPAALASIYPQLVQHGMQHCGSTDVLRFLGRVVPAHGHVHRLYKGEVETSLHDRPEGVRLKHYASGNSIKLYDKHGQVLRVETTMNHPEAFRVYRTPEGQPHRLKRWRPLRKGVADLPRRAQICRGANDRYLAALPAVSTDKPAGKLARPVCQPNVRRKPAPPCAQSLGRARCHAPAHDCSRRMGGERLSQSRPVRRTLQKNCREDRTSPAVRPRDAPDRTASRPWTHSQGYRHPPLYHHCQRTPAYHYAPRRSTGLGRTINKTRGLKSCSKCAIPRHYYEDEPRRELARRVQHNDSKSGVSFRKFVRQHAAQRRSLALAPCGPFAPHNSKRAG